MAPVVKHGSAIHILLLPRSMFSLFRVFFTLLKIARPHKFLIHFSAYQFMMRPGCILYVNIPTLLISIFLTQPSVSGHIVNGDSFLLHRSAS